MDPKNLFVIGTLFVMVFTTNIGDVISQERQSFETLVTRVKKGDQTVDFKALRIAYTETAQYNPYGADHEVHNIMFDALQNKQFEKAIEHATTQLNKNFVDIDTHFVCLTAYREMKNMEKYSFHNLITRELIDSIMNSGDGKTPETAFVVINVREEYILLNILSLKKEKQSLIESNGRWYDRMEVMDLKKNQKVEVFFNVDLPYNWLTKRMRK